MLGALALPRFVFMVTCNESGQGGITCKRSHHIFNVPQRFSSIEEKLVDVYIYRLYVCIYKISTIVPSQDRDSEYFPRISALSSTQRGPFGFLLPLLLAPATASPGWDLFWPVLKHARTAATQKYAKPAKRRNVYAPSRMYNGGLKGV